MQINKGFSLVELLVAITLLSMMLFIATFGFQQFSRYWDDEFGHFNSRFNKLRGFNILLRTLQDIKPYLVIGTNKQPYYYFEGGVSVIRSIRSHSVTDPSMPAAFQIKVLEDPDNIGKFRIEYAETAFNGSNFKSESAWGDYSYKMVILNGVDDIAFSYFGWPHYDQYLLSIQSAQTAMPQLYGNYSGRDTWMTPDQINVNIIVDGQTSNFSSLLPAIREDLLDFHLVTEQ